MLGDWILMITLFLSLGGVETIAKNRALDGKTSRKRALLEYTASFYIVVFAFLAVSILYRWTLGLPADGILNVKFIYVVGLGLAGTHIWTASQLWRKLTLGGVPD